jgi:ABC-2 type transport system permease protein
MAAFLVPLLVISLALTPMQMAATSMAVENEERTLETLLTLPVRPRDILLAKLLGMFAVALLGSALEIAGLLAYFFIIFSISLPGEPQLAAGAARLPGLQLGALQGFIDPSGVALLGASILLSLFFFAALGVIVGALSRDVRIASTVIGPLGFLAVIPSHAYRLHELGDDGAGPPHSLLHTTSHPASHRGEGPCLLHPAARNPPLPRSLPPLHPSARYQRLKL